MIATQTRDDTVHRGTSPVGKSVLFSDGTFLLVGTSLPEAVGSPFVDPFTC